MGNGDCASTCAQFSTVMYERHNTTVVNFGGKLNEPMQYKGMAGAQVLEWADIDTEIKTTGVKNVRSSGSTIRLNANKQMQDTLAPPDL